MKDEGTQFYAGSIGDFDLKDFPIDNGTTTVYIPTPEGWVCPRNGCRTDVLHKHGTYEALKA